MNFNKRIYARIDILDLQLKGDDPSFNRSASVYLLGDAAADVKSEKDISLSNKKLVSHIGAEVIKLISPESFKHGGDIESALELRDNDEDWDNFEMGDIEEMLASPEQDDKAKENSKKEKLKENLFKEFTLFSKDKVVDILDMVAIVTGIDPYKQYLWLSSCSKSLTADLLSLMDHWKLSMRRIQAFPVDTTQLTRDSNVFTTAPLESLVDGKGAVVISCISLDSIVETANRSRLRFLARSDPDSYELIHANAIKRFFPAITLPIFNQYIINNDDLQLNYPHLAWEQNTLIAQYNRRTTLFEDIKAHMQNMAKSTQHSNISVSIISLVFACPSLASDDVIDTLKLFQAIDITNASCNAIADIDLFGVYNNDSGKNLRLRKLRQQDHFRTNHQSSVIGLFGGIVFKQQLIRSQTIVISCLPTDTYKSLAIGISKYGSVWIRARTARLDMTMDTFCNEIATTVKQIIDLINSTPNVFTTQKRLEHFDFVTSTQKSKYEIMSSSSRLIFSFSPSYTKLVDLFIKYLENSGLAKPSAIASRASKNLMTVVYGVASKVANSVTNFELPSIEITNMEGVAILGLVNFDIEETQFYVDLISCIVALHKKSLEISIKAKSSLVATDPVLYRPQVGSKKYRRICQRQYQPVVTTKDDKGAVEYFNFTFNRPEYYKCPNPNTPELGLISGKHPQGYCFPCCRKTSQKTFAAKKSSCIDPSSEGADDDKSGRRSTYKVLYPTEDVSNKKFVGRRILLPPYVSKLLHLGDVVANGAIVASRQDDVADVKQSTYQSLMLIAARETSHGSKRPSYASPRELALDVVGMLKHPQQQARFMRNKLVSSRFTTPLGFLHAFEDQFMKETILQSNTADLSSVEWNDLVVFLANIIGMNVLLLSDERIASKGIQILNIEDIDISKPVMLVLKRIDSEWSDKQTNTRAMYLPITHNSYRVLSKSRLVVPTFKLSAYLSKIKNITSGPRLAKLWKQFSLNRCSDFVNHSKDKFSILRIDLPRKILEIGVDASGKKIITSMLTSKTLQTSYETHSISDADPDASLSDCLAFITNYNAYYVRRVAKLNDVLKSYKLYLAAALQKTKVYALITLEVYLLKVGRFVMNGTDVVAVVVDLVDGRNVTQATELMFFKPQSRESTLKEIILYQENLYNFHKAVDAYSVITFPISAHLLLATDKTFPEAFIQWVNNPLDVMRDKNKVHENCQMNMKKSLNKGVYTNMVYQVAINEIIVNAWGKEFPDELIAAVVKRLPDMWPRPIAQTSIDKLITEFAAAHSKYDALLVRKILTPIFDKINAEDQTVNDAVDRVKAEPSLQGFDLRNVFRYTKKQIEDKVNMLLNSLSLQVTDYPTFELDMPLNKQQDRLIDSGTHKLLIHKDVYEDVRLMIVADLGNPFRRDYIINAPAKLTQLFDIQPHVGEIIFYE